jgi:hypothetical protein
MKGAKHLNLLVPALVLACIALFYFDGCSSYEGFQASGGSTALALTPPAGTTTYHIYVKRTGSAKGNISYVNMTSTAGGASGETPDPSNAKFGFGLNFPPSSFNSINITLPASMQGKLADYDVYGSGNATAAPPLAGAWTLKSDQKTTSFINAFYQNVNTIIRKPGATGVLQTQVALPLAAGKTLTGSIMLNALQPDNFFRIDLNVKN